LIVEQGLLQDDDLQTKTMIVPFHYSCVPDPSRGILDSIAILPIVLLVSNWGVSGKINQRTLRTLCPPVIQSAINTPENKKLVLIPCQGVG
jgi:hypothetical protein